MSAWLARRRHRKAVAEVHRARGRRLPWLWLAANVHHTQHPGERHDDCGVCVPASLFALLEELEPMPTNGATS